jgi:hypothetical protein
MLLAHHVWEATPDGATADEETFATAYDRAMEEESESFRAASETLSANERKVVTRIAAGVETMNTRSSAVPFPAVRSRLPWRRSGTGR